MKSVEAHVTKSKAEFTNPNAPFVVQYAEIPPAPERARTPLKVRPFVGNRLLGTNVPGRGVALEMVHLPPGQHAARRTSSRCLLIVLEGRAELATGARHSVRTGDAVTIPQSFEYGITAGPKGLEAMVVSFSGGQGEAAKQVLTAEQLVARNQERAQASLKKAFFQKLASDTLRAPATRRRFCDHLRVFSDAFQAMLFARQASCSEAKHAAVFADHLREELGHNELLGGPEARQVAFDPVLHATATWFCNQMFLLDDLDKMVVNLVLETAGYHFNQLAEPVFASDSRAKYFEVHGIDEDHQNLGVDLLQNQSPQVYRRLGAVLDRTWDMFEAMTGRIVELVENGTEVADES